MQQIDTQLDHVRSSLQTIHETLEDDAVLRGALARVEAEQEQHHQASRELQVVEAEAGSQQSRIQQAEASLYGGLVQNPKELQDLQADVISLKRFLATLEDRELEAMSRAENAESQLRAAQLELERLKTDLGDQQRNLLAQQSALTKELERLASEREAVVQAIKDAHLAEYESLRVKRRGLAVSAIADSACSACGATLTAAIQQSARSASQLVQCPSCGRILYAA